MLIPWRVCQLPATCRCFDFMQIAGVEVRSEKRTMDGESLGCGGAGMLQLFRSS